MVDDATSSPVVMTIQPPQGVGAMELVERSRQWGYLIGGESGYLRDKNWVQLSTMGDLTRDDCEGWLSSMQQWLKARQ
jgi:aspartate aminotransferase-like enzyme